jgi:hypothetical protein
VRSSSGESVDLARRALGLLAAVWDGRFGRYHPGLERLGEPDFQELSELGCCPELRDGIQFFECRRERIGKTPDGSRPELLVFRLEVEVVYGASQVLGCLQFALD